MRNLKPNPYTMTEPGLRELANVAKMKSISVHIILLEHSDLGKRTITFSGIDKIACTTGFVSL